MNWRPIVGGIAAVGLFVAFLVAGSLAAMEGSQANARDFQVSSESLTVDYENTSTVTASDRAIRFFDNETVRNSSGTVLSEGDDYRWNTSSGSIEWINSTDTTEGANATIAYGFTGWSETTGALRQTTSDYTALLPYAILVVVAIVAAGGVVAIGLAVSSNSALGGNF
jgi:hypothetical protein